MIRWLMRVVLGGRSNKREATFLAFLISCGWNTFIIWQTAQGVDMSAVIGLATTVTVVTLGSLLGATALHHLGGANRLDRDYPPQGPGL